MNNILKGRLVQWDSKKGFGFIHPLVGSEDIFIHISDFKDKRYKPIIGDKIVYQLAKGRGNKKKAINAYPKKNDSDRKILQSKHKYRKNKNIFSRKRLFVLFFLGILFTYSDFFKNDNIQYEEKHVFVENTFKDKEFNEFQEKQDNFTDGIKIKEDIKDLTWDNKYKCDGRQYCSQMQSCDEAKYFIEHCPNTKMDGDNDGIPCEKQWCRY